MKNDNVVQSLYLNVVLKTQPEFNVIKTCYSTVKAMCTIMSILNSSGISTNTQLLLIKKCIEIYKSEDGIEE